MMRATQLFFLVLTTLTIGCHSRARRDDVAQRGASVMPFDLERTTHVFEATTDGGLQQVLSDDGDAKQVSLIRAHLSEQAERFACGDFHAPGTIHGEHMPGLHELVMGHERLTVAYEETAAGAQIRYSSEDAELVESIHRWFDAQLSDHGSHAQRHR